MTNSTELPTDSMRVTPEMIEAGVAFLEDYEFSPVISSRALESVVCRLFLTMLAHSLPGVLDSEVEPIECNLPFEHLPVCAHDPGVNEPFVCFPCGVSYSPDAHPMGT